jgi:hypothetical protein
VAVSAHNIAFGYLGEKALPGPDDDHGADITELLLPVPVIKVHNEVREFPPTVGAGNALDESGYLASLLDVPAPVDGAVDLEAALGSSDTPFPGPEPGALPIELSGIK